MRVVIAEDLALLREGLVALLRENEIEVVAQVEDGPGLLRAIAGHEPDLAIVDVRLPPTFSDEGLRAAIEARRRQPALGVLVLSQYVETAYASELIGENTAGIGYLLKERDRRRQSVPRRAARAWPRAAPCSTARSSRNCSCRATAQRTRLRG